MCVYVRWQHIVAEIWMDNLCMCTPQAQCMQVYGVCISVFCDYEWGCMVCVYTKRATHSCNCRLSR